MLTSRLRQTIPVAISGFIGDQQYFWGEMAAAATLSAIPMLIFAMLVQKHMIRGLTLGAVK
jgi:multiple sugar transport system permease protein